MDVACWSPGCVGTTAGLVVGDVVTGGVVTGGVVASMVGDAEVAGEVNGDEGTADGFAHAAVGWIACMADAAPLTAPLGAGLAVGAQDDVGVTLGDGCDELVPMPCPGELIMLCEPFVNVPLDAPCDCPVDMTEPSWTIACRTGGTVMARVAAKATLAAASAGRTQPM